MRAKQSGQLLEVAQDDRIGERGRCCNREGRVLLARGDLAQQDAPGAQQARRTLDHAPHQIKPVDASAQRGLRLPFADIPRYIRPLRITDVWRIRAQHIHRTIDAAVGKRTVQVTLHHLHHGLQPMRSDIASRQFYRRRHHIRGNDAKSAKRILFGSPWTVRSASRPRQLPTPHALCLECTRHSDGNASRPSAQVHDAQRRCSDLTRGRCTSDRLLHQQFGARPWDQRRWSHFKFASMERPPADEVLHWFVTPCALHELTEFRQLFRRGYAVRVEIEGEAFASNDMRKQQV